jgi:hypothetical protein
MPMAKVSCTSISPCQAQVYVPSFHPQTVSDRSHRGQIRITRQAQKGGDRVEFIVQRQRIGYKGLGQQPYLAEDRPPVLVDTEVGVAHVGEHYAFTANTDRSRLLLGRDREQAVRLAQITC